MKLSKPALSAFVLTLLVAATVGTDTTAQHHNSDLSLAAPIEADLAALPVPAMHESELAFGRHFPERKLASCTDGTEAGRIREWFKKLFKKIKRWLKEIRCRWTPDGYEGIRRF